MEEILERQDEVRVLKPARDGRKPIEFDFESVFDILGAPAHRAVRDGKECEIDAH